MKPKASQTVGNLRTLVTRRAGVRRKVALLVPDAELVQALEHNQCTVLVDPPSLDELTAFGPDVVLAFDGFLSQGVSGLHAVTRAVPQAEVMVCFANSSSASLLIRSLQGLAPTPSSSETQVCSWLAEAGLVVKARDVVVTAHVNTALCADTEAALRQLFEQLNPDAAADRLLLVAKPGVDVISAKENIPGLTSVVVSALDDVTALEGTLRSLLGQLQRPLEVVVVSSLPQAQLEEAVARAKTTSGIEVQTRGQAPSDALAQTNIGLELARGQYVCAVEAGELLERAHLSALVSRLAQGTEAWALSSPPHEMGARFELKQWLDAGMVHRGRFVVDRSRLGTFPLRFAEGVEWAEAILFCRLAALFSPAWSAGPCTLDSERRVPSSSRALVQAMVGRPLRTVETLEAQLRELKPVELNEVLQQRMAQHSPTAGKLFGTAIKWSEHVRQAAQRARSTAKAALQKK